MKLQNNSDMELQEYFEAVVQKTQCIKVLATTFCGGKEKLLNSQTIKR